MTEKSIAEGTPIYPIAAFFGDGLGPNLENDPRPALHFAQLIIGRDVMTEHEFLLYGWDVLHALPPGGERLATIRIALDMETDELEKASALVQVVKGRCDYHYVCVPDASRAGGDGRISG